MPSAIVVGGGLAGLSAALRLAEAGFRVELFEARPALGGRASSWTPPEGGEPIDNCQHILLGCCSRLLDFYARLGVRDLIRFHREFNFLERGGRLSRLRAGPWPAPWHLVGSFLRLPFLSPSDKLAVIRALRALARESGRRDLDDITMDAWLAAQRQTPAALRRFWQPVLVSAVNEELDRMAAAHGFQVLREAFLGERGGYELGVPTVPLSRLHDRPLPGVTVHLRSPVASVAMRAGAARGVITSAGLHEAEHVILAVPAERVPALAPELELDLAAFEFVPIIGLHLWFDRPVTALPHAVLLESPLHWVFNKQQGRYLLAVASAARELAQRTREELLALARRELGDYFPAARAAQLERAHLVKELRATFSAKPGLEAHRPAADTRIRGLFLAGDWTRTGWPATMEGAVLSGYLAAEAVTRAATGLRD